VLFGAHIGKTLFPKRGQGNVKGVHPVVLAGVACGEKTGSGRELGGGTSTTLSPAATRCRATERPNPPAPSTAQRRSGKRLPQRTSERSPALLVEKTAYSSSFARSSMTARVFWWPCGDRCRYQYLHVDLLPALADNVYSQAWRTSRVGGVGTQHTSVESLRACGRRWVAGLEKASPLHTRAARTWRANPTDALEALSGCRPPSSCSELNKSALG
jgi:hypothetical protein